PLMGAIAVRNADAVIVTSDNPRGEAPGAILADILAGITPQAAAAVIEDRREAIAQAVGRAAGRDVIVIAGKGHEDYQEIAGIKHPFSDIDEARAALAKRVPPC
ncbi:MAG TPA: UDP-N-acetylmuramoyl-L-alanyl-D-glutamate--2,6-diaminopimelate ligase, partial [Burkholderiaceae bacterium]